MFWSLFEKNLKKRLILFDPIFDVMDCVAFGRIVIRLVVSDMRFYYIIIRPLVDNGRPDHRYARRPCKAGTSLWWDSFSKCRILQCQVYDCSPNGDTLTRMGTFQKLIYYPENAEDSILPIILSIFSRLKSPISLPHPSSHTITSLQFQSFCKMPSMDTATYMSLCVPPLTRTLSV